MPEISVIVPVYKVEKYIHRCVDSILAQTFTDFELILVDDGSPDNCGRICDEYAQKDSRVHVIHKENSGVSAARNRGISESVGVYITFVDSDDYIDLDYLLNLYSNRSNLTICGFVAENPSGDIVYRNVYSSIRYSSREEIDFARLYRENAVYSVYCKLFTKEIIDLYGLHFPDGICWGEDGMFVADYLQHIESIRVTEYMGYHYMISQSNNSLATRICADSVERVASSREYCIDKMKETSPRFFDEVKYYCMFDIRQNCAYFIKLLLCDESLEKREKVRILDYFLENQYVREVIEDPVSYFPNDKVMHISARQKSSERMLRKYKRLSKRKKSIDAFNAWIKRSMPSKVKKIYRMRKKVINRTIHYCWFGRNPKPDLALSCIESWKKHCPDYEIIEWNEDNFDISACPLYVRQAYEMKKWPFVTDYVRLKVVYDHGGVYMDTDVELKKSLDSLLEYHAYFGFEDGKQIATGLGFGAEKGCAVVFDMMTDYDHIPFVQPDGSFDMTPCPERNTSKLLLCGMKQDNRKQILDGNILILPSDYLCPIDYLSGKKRITRNTVSIHWFAESWKSEQDKQIIREIRKRKKLSWIIAHFLITQPKCWGRRIIGVERYEKIKTFFKRG